MIADLEKEWKIVLLERDRNGVRLTSDGLRLLPFAKSLCREYDRLQEEVDELNGIQSRLSWKKAEKLRYPLSSRKITQCPSSPHINLL